MTAVTHLLLFLFTKREKEIIRKKLLSEIKKIEIEISKKNQHDQLLDDAMSQKNIEYQELIYQKNFCKKNFAAQKYITSLKVKRGRGEVEITDQKDI